jgi:coenzyme F420-reducing hydrogenase alpha subunit
MERLPAGLPALCREISEEHGAVDNLTIAKRLRMLRQEICEIMVRNRDHPANTQHGKFGFNMHNKRRQRLEEIKEELAAMQIPSAVQLRGKFSSRPF